MSCFSGACGLCSSCNPDEPFPNRLRFQYYSPTSDYEETGGYQEYKRRNKEFLRKEKIRQTKLDDLIKETKEN